MLDKTVSADKKILLELLEGSYIFFWSYEITNLQPVIAYNLEKPFRTKALSVNSRIE